MAAASKNGFHRCLVLAAIKFRSRVLKQFEMLLSQPADAGPITSEQRVLPAEPTGRSHRETMLDARERADLDAQSAFISRIAARA